jgi:glutamate/tyrosine decarboxylase-like PLP-dependent enzyme
VAGVADADSWATDAHKWLNVPYDSGLAFVREAEHLRGAMSLTAAYLPQGVRREPLNFVPELSRRARGVDTWAALKSLGRSGLGELIDRNCRCARRFADGLANAGFEILNDVILNQVLVSFGTPEITERVMVFRKMAPVGAVLRFGRDVPPCASVSLPGQPRRRTSTAVCKRCCASRGVSPRNRVTDPSRDRKGAVALVGQAST